MSYLTNAVEKVAASIEAAKNAHPMKKISTLEDGLDVLMKTLRMMATRIDAIDDRIDLAIKEYGEAIDNLESKV